ncbi:hypothetical protein E3G68_005245 [Mycobacteroides abscessus]|nr:hypothetical protein [Mycobacteroides abscessus]
MNVPYLPGVEADKHAAGPRYEGLNGREGY